MTQYHSIFFKGGDKHGASFENVSTSTTYPYRPLWQKRQIFGKVGLKIGLSGKVNIDENF